MRSIQDFVTILIGIDFFCLYIFYIKSESED